jgi:hypothetical protein
VPLARGVAGADVDDMDRISLSLSVSGVAAVQAPKRDLPPNPRPTTEQLDTGEDEFSPAELGAQANVYDELLDRLRLAALRRDAAATSAVETAKAQSPTADTWVAERPPVDRS